MLMLLLLLVVVSPVKPSGMLVRCHQGGTLPHRLAVKAVSLGRAQAPQSQETQGKHALAVERDQAYAQWS